MVAKAAKNVHPPPPQMTDDQVAITTHFVPPPLNFTQPVADQGTSKLYPFVICAPQFHIGEPSFRPTVLTVIIGSETFISFQLLQANLGM